MSALRTLAASLLLTTGALTACGGQDAPSNEEIGAKDADIRKIGVKEIGKIDSPYFLAGDKILSLDTINIRYRDEGPKTAPVLVLIHGFSVSLETWDALAADLSNDYRVIRMDLPGHGLTGPDPQKRYTNADTVGAIEDMLNALGIEKAALIGSSLGGLVAWRTALSSPDRVDKLVLIAPGGYSINGVTDKPEKVPPMVKMYFTKAPRSGVKRATGALFGDPAKLTDARIDTIVHMMKRAGNGEALIERAEMFTLPDPSSDLENVKTPTLILWGDQDIMVPPEHGPQFEKHMPNAALISYAGTGHIPHEEIPEQTARDIRAFLSTK